MRSTTGDLKNKQGEEHEREGAPVPRGYPRNPEATREKMRAAQARRNFSDEKKREIGEKIRQSKLGHEHSYTHRRSGHQSYQRWYHMMSRCYNEKHKQYKDYGGRGIQVYEPWHDVVTFTDWLDENLGPCPEGYSIDRINNDGNYEPGNIRWATTSQQRYNQRSRQEMREMRE